MAGKEIDAAALKHKPAKRRNISAAGLEPVMAEECIAGLFDGRVEVVDREGLKTYVRAAAPSEALYAF
jgi:hypothetical protein